MPRPRKYVRRVDTRVRIREDQARALQDRVDSSGLSRNVLMEQALDAFLKTKRPRLQKAPTSPDITGTTQTNARARVKPSLHKIGEEQAKASTAGPPPVVPPKTAKPTPLHGPPERPMRRPKRLNG